jgi:hypothetical protein
MQAVSDSLQTPAAASDSLKSNKPVDKQTETTAASDSTKTTKPKADETKDTSS